MGEIDVRITDRMRDRVQVILVADGVPDGVALAEANSICDGLGYYPRVTSGTGLRFATTYDGVQVFGNGGDLIETIPYERLDQFF